MGNAARLLNIRELRGGKDGGAQGDEKRDSFIVDLGGLILGPSKIRGLVVFSVFILITTLLIGEQIKAIRSIAGALSFTTSLLVSVAIVGEVAVFCLLINWLIKRRDRKFRQIRDELKFKQSIIKIIGTAGNGSGFVAGKIGNYYILLTNTHVVFRDAKNRQKVKIETRRPPASETLGSAAVVLCNVDERPDIGDIAVLVMKEEETPGRRLVPIQIAFEVKKGKIATMVSACNDNVISGYLSPEGEGNVTLQPLFLLELQSSPGDSGSPYLIKIDDDYFVAAIHTGRIRGDSPRGMLITPGNIKEMLRALNKEPVDNFEVVTEDNLAIAAVRKFLEELLGSHAEIKSADGGANLGEINLTEILTQFRKEFTQDNITEVLIEKINCEILTARGELDKAGIQNRQGLADYIRWINEENKKVADKITRDKSLINELLAEFCGNIIEKLRKGQFFYDGNRSTASIIASLVLVSYGMMPLNESYMQLFSHGRHPSEEIRRLILHWGMERDYRLDGKNFRKIAKLPAGAEFGRDFIHWKK